MNEAVGLIGLGNMGAGVAANLVGKVGRAIFWDINESARDRFEGNENVGIEQPGEMAANATVILLAVPSAKEIAILMEGSDGILANGRPGTVLVDLTTSYPVDSKNLASKAEAAGLAYLDAGMSGGAQGAAEGRLTLMVGGDAAAFERAKPALQCFAKEIFHMGPSGAGHTAKILQNLVTHTVFLATCEAGRMAGKAGIELETLIDLFNVSNARSFITERRFPDHILSETWDGKSRVFNQHKDLDFAARLADDLGMKAAYARVTRDLLAAGMELGMEDTDFTRLYEVYEELL
jgi:3-hydroxyisobutyrate dehydrogenase